MTAAEIRIHIRYTGWASRKVVEAALALSPENQVKPMGVSHESIAKTLFHIYMADRIWFKRTVDPDLAMPPWNIHLPMSSFLSEWQTIQQRWEDWAESLTDEDLAKPVYFQSLNGTPGEASTLHVVLHVVNHGTLHRGQVVAMLRQLGVKPPTTDLMAYYREIKAVATAS